MTDAQDEDARRIAELVGRARSAMLTTTTAEGRHVSRPMALQEVGPDGDLWFFAYDDSAKVQQIQAAPEVNVSFTDTRHNSWTSVAGRAELVHDRARAERLYSPVLKAWFPDGLETAGIALIRVRTETAEYWDSPSSTVGMAVGAARAVVTRDPDAFPTDNRTVQL